MSCIVLLSIWISCDEYKAIDPRLFPVDDSDSLAWSVEEEMEEEIVYKYVEVMGHYVHAFEVSYFYPCGSDEQWWVTGGMLRERYYKVVERRGDLERIYVRCGGMLSEAGRYGHMGGGDRAFEVTKIIEARKRSDIDCR